MFDLTKFHELSEAESAAVIGGGPIAGWLIKPLVPIAAGEITKYWADFVAGFKAGRDAALSP